MVARIDWLLVSLFFAKLRHFRILNMRLIGRVCEFILIALAAMLRPKKGFIPKPNTP